MRELALPSACSVRVTLSRPVREIAVTAQPVEQKTSRRLPARPGLLSSRLFSSRSLSIVLALLANANLIVLLLRRNPIASASDIEPFWVQQFVGLAIYSALQLWTLAQHAGRGDELAATVDKVFAASPAIVTALIQMYWIGHDSAASLSWRQHVVSALWSLIAIADFFATSITDKRLRTRQMNLTPPGN
jgi:hypothetical protein